MLSFIKNAKISYVSGLIVGYINILIGSLVTLFLVPYLINHLGKEATGIYFILGNLVNFVAVGIGWLASVGIKLIVDQDIKSNSDVEKVSKVHLAVFLGYGLYSAIAFLLIMGSSLLIGEKFLVSSSDEIIRQTKTSLILVGAYIFCMYLHSADLSLFTAKLKQGTSIGYRILAQLLFVIFIYFWVRFDIKLDKLFLALLISVIITAIVARIHLIVIGYLPKLQLELPDKKVIKDMFITIGGQYFLFSILQFLLIYADILIVGYFLGAEAVASFLIIWKIPEFMILVILRISDILSPYLTKLNAKNDNKILQRVFLSFSRLQYYLAISACIGYCIFGPYVVSLWVGGDKCPERWMFYLAGISLALQIMNRHDVILHLALAKLKKVTIIHAVEMLLKITIMVFLFPKYGIASPLISYIIVQALGIAYFYKVTSISTLKLNKKDWLKEVGGPTLLFLTLTLLILSIPANVIKAYHHWNEYLAGIFALGVMFLLVIVFLENRNKNISVFKSIKYLN